MAEDPRDATRRAHEEHAKRADERRAQAEAMRARLAEQVAADRKTIADVETQRRATSQRPRIVEPRWRPSSKGDNDLHGQYARDNVAGGRTRRDPPGL